MAHHRNWLLVALLFVGASFAIAQQNSAPVAQIVALDECDPATFNTALGPDFCKNVTLGAFTTLDRLFKEAETGHPDPKWDFEPDSLEVQEGTILRVSDEGGEPHTFTEVARFGGGFIPQLNGPTASPAPECAGGFSNIAVAVSEMACRVCCLRRSRSPDVMGPV